MGRKRGGSRSAAGPDGFDALVRSRHVSIHIFTRATIIFHSHRFNQHIKWRLGKVSWPPGP